MKSLYETFHPTLIGMKSLTSLFIPGWKYWDEKSVGWKVPDSVYKPISDFDDSCYPSNAHPLWMNWLTGFIYFSFIYPFSHQDCQLSHIQHETRAIPHISHTHTHAHMCHTIVSLLSLHNNNNNNNNKQTEQMSVSVSLGRTKRSWDRACDNWLSAEWKTPNSFRDLYTHSTKCCPDW